MVRELAVEGMYVFWLAGYYDDFMGARTLPDNLATPSDSIWHSSKSHQGNPINGFAELNPRYKYAWCVRGDGDSAQFNNPGITSTDRYTYNSGVGEWASFDITRQRPLTLVQQHIASYSQGLGSQLYEHMAQLQYPDSLTNANRQRFDGGTGIVGGSTKAYETTATESNYAVVEGYMMFCNGYNTTGKYYSAIGTNDSTFGRDTHVGILDFSSGQNLSTFAGMPNDGAPRTNANNAKTVRTHLAGVYSGEVVTSTDVDAGAPAGGALMPIESLCGKPFLVIEANQESSSYEPVLVYDGSLNSKGTGDFFTIRWLPMAVDKSTAEVRLRIGCEGTAFTSTVSGDTGYSRAAIDITLTGSDYLKDFQYMTSYAGTDMKTLWQDWEIYINYDTNTWNLYIDGATVLTSQAMGTKADGSNFTAADMYGWEIDVKDAEEKVAILIDRVGLVRPLNDHSMYSFVGANEVVAVDFNMTMGVNSTSTLNCTMIDDDKLIAPKLIPLFKEQSYSDWSLLMFHGKTIDRPLWRGLLNSLSFTQDTTYTPTIKISASDYWGMLDNQMPTWEVGQGGEGDTTSQVAYDRSEAQNNLNTYYFGASALDVANATLGFNEVEDGAGTFVEHLDSRMRNRSAHPIQMYTGEDDIGPSNSYDDWRDAIAAGHATSDATHRAIQSRWMLDFKVSPWFRHMFSKIAKDPVATTTATSNFTRGGTSLLLDCGLVPTSEAGSFEVNHSDGFLDAGCYTSAAITANKSVTVSEIGTTIGAGYAELIEVNRGGNYPSGAFGAGSGYLTDVWYYVDLWLPSVTIGHPDGGAWNAVAKLYGKDIALSGWTGTGDTATELNGVWRVSDPISRYPNTSQPWNTNNLRVATSDSTPLTRVRLYHVNNPDSDRLHNFTSSAGMSWTYAGNGSISFLSVNWTGTPDGGVQLTDSGADTWTVYKRVETFTGGTVSYGTTLTLPTTNFLQRDISTTDSISVRYLDTNNYKHIWILWADMRNNGEANADNRLRQKSFGLMTPYAANYGLTLDFANNAISNTEERATFTDLKIGEEVDMWEMDATADPITGVSWSANTGASDGLNTLTTINGAISAGATSITLTSATGWPTSGNGAFFPTSNTTTDFFSYTGVSGNILTGVSGVKFDQVDGASIATDNLYANWEGKAGSFVIFDTSKFFNLNTTSTNGKTGQDSGGRKEIGDYLVETEGFPVLVDNYWKRVPPTFLNLDDEASWNANYKYLINEGTNLITPVLRDDRIIQLAVKDKVIPPSATQVGKMVSAEKKTVFHYAAFADVDLVNTSVVATNNGAGKVRLTAGNNVSVGGSSYKAGELYRVGHEIVLSSSTGTTTSIDGTYRITDAGKAESRINMASGVADAASVLTLDDASNFSTTGNGYIINATVGISIPFSWTGKSSNDLTGCSGILQSADNSVVTEIGLAGTTGYMEIDIDPSVTISTGTVTVSAPTSIKLRNLVSLGKSVTGSTDPGVWDGTNYPTAGSTPSSGTPENNAYWLTYYGGVGGLPQPTGATTYISNQAIPIDPEDNNAYKDLIVYGGLANVMPMSLLMVINGFIECKGDGTWYDSGKIRTTYLDSLNNNWLSQTVLSGMPDIGSVPITYNTNVDNQSSVISEGRGGLIGLITQTSASVQTVTTQSDHGLATGNTITIVDCPWVNSSLFDGLRYRDFTVTVTGATTFTIVNDVLTYSPPLNNSSWGRWRLASSVDSFGGVNDCRNVTVSTVFSSTQALSGVSDYYGSKQVYSYYMSRDSKPAYRPNYSINLLLDSTNMRVASLTTQSTKQITNVRVFYGGGGSFVDYPEPTLGTAPRWEILTMPAVDSGAEALKIAKAEYEKYKKAPLQLQTDLLNFTNKYALSGNNNIMLDEARYGYIADQSRTIPKLWQTTGGGGPGYETNVHAGRYWASLKGGNLFPGMVSALNGRDGDAGYTSGNLTYDENYYWYGANSVSYAVQVVHIPRGMPKVSQKTPGGANIAADGKLRVAIEVGNGVDYGSVNSVVSHNTWESNMLFTIRLLDYDWTNLTFEAHERSSSTVTVDSNGLYEIDIPSTYWSSGRDGSERIVVSVNYDYLMALARRRCDSSVGGMVTQEQKTYDNSNPQEAYVGGVLMPAAWNSGVAPVIGKSIFPLGMRSYGTADYWNLRTEWYAPRLHICDDINFTPGVQVVVNDATSGLDAEKMGIKQINWSQSGRQTTRASLTLERDVSINATNFGSLFAPAVRKGNSQTGGEGSTQGGGGGGSSTSGRGGPSGNPSNLPPGFSPSDDSGNSGNPKVGGWGQAGGFGGGKPGSVKGSQLNPISFSGVGSNPDGLSFGGASGITLSSNNLALGTMNKIKGTMDFNNDSVTGGSFAVLGQKKPSKPPRNESGIEGIDSHITPSGDSVMSNEGMSLAGWAGGEAPKTYNEFVVTVRAPPNPESSKIRVEGKYTLNTISSSQVAYLQVNVMCLETGRLDTNTITLQAGSQQNVVLYEGTLGGMEIAGNTLKVSIGREAGVSPDTATYSSVNIHNVQVATDRRSVDGDTQSNQFGYSA